MNTIESHPDFPLRPMQGFEGRKENRVDKSFSEQVDTTEARETITEKTVTEIAVRMDFLGLEFRKIDSQETQYTRSGSKKSQAQKEEESAFSGTIFEAEILNDANPKPEDMPENARKMLRAYLPGNPDNKGLKYLA